MNQVLEAIKKRSSIRAYTDAPITAEQLRALKEAALASPTAMDRQAQRFLFITDKALISDIESAVVDSIVASGDAAAIARTAARDNKIIYDAPLLVVIAIPKDSSIAKVDAGIAVQNLALAATSLGLDSVILGMPSVAFEQEEICNRAKMPKDLIYGISIAIGNRAMDKEPHVSDASHIIEVK
ncbi:MAG: nitroreductase family protein [Christensenellaceae bacterium]|jgi:nitroreductase